MSIEFIKPASPLVGIDDTQTMKNKTLDGGTTKLQDSSDPTKLAHFDMSGLPTGTDSIISLSNTIATLNLYNYNNTGGAL